MRTKQETTEYSAVDTASAGQVGALARVDLATLSFQNVKKYTFVV
jgi:hypothetical protein